MVGLVKFYSLSVSDAKNRSNNAWHNKPRQQVDYHKSYVADANLMMKPITG